MRAWPFISTAAHVLLSLTPLRQPSSDLHDALLTNLSSPTLKMPTSSYGARYICPDNGLSTVSWIPHGQPTLLLCPRSHLTPPYPSESDLAELCRVLNMVQVQEDGIAKYGLLAMQDRFMQSLRSE